MGTKLKRHIHLRDLSHVATPRSGGYSSYVLDKARSALVERDLRYDNSTGMIRDSSGELERYVNQADFTPHETEEAVMRWEFKRYIYNSASRLERGFEA